MNRTGVICAAWSTDERIAGRHFARHSACIVGLLFIAMLSACSVSEPPCHGDSCAATEAGLYLTGTEDSLPYSCSVVLKMSPGAEWNSTDGLRAAVEQRGLRAAISLVHETGAALPSRLGWLTLRAMEPLSFYVVRSECFGADGMQMLGVAAKLGLERP